MRDGSRIRSMICGAGAAALLLATSSGAQTPEQTLRFESLFNTCVEDPNFRAAIAGCDGAIAMVEESDLGSRERALIYSIRGARFASHGIRENDHDAKEKARADLNRALGFDQSPDIVTKARHRLGEIDADDGRYYEATEQFTAALAANPKMAQSYAMRGAAWWRKDHNILARLDYAAALRIDPANADARYLRGVLNNEEGRFEEALADYTFLIDADPDHANARFNRALLHSSRKNFAAALADLDELVARRPNQPRYVNARGDLHMRMNAAGKAVADYRRALQLDPRNVGYKKDLEAAEKALKARR